MQTIVPTLVPGLASREPRARLRSWPQVLADLEQAGVALERLPGESADATENRVGTGLMALYRDTRSDEAFEALYAFSRQGVLQWIQGLVRRARSPVDPHELLQDTFVNVYRYPSAFRSDHPGSFRVWVRTIAGNLVRRAGSPRRRLSFQELPEGLQEPEDTRGDPVALAATTEQEDLLRSAWILFLCHYRRAWSELSDRDRRALHLVEVEGLSYQEAAGLLGVGRSNMKMIVFRARVRIARRMRAAMGTVAAAA